jgi:pimeloyl-ACP methyl ester carboxylesterase
MNGTGAWLARARVPALIAALVFAVVPVACGGHAAARTRRVPGQPGLEYAVHRDFLYLLCTGHGSPTVVLEPGLNGDHRGWSLVQPQLARTTRVCSYDRSGLGLSQLAPKRGTAREKASDLHALLQAARVDGPLVLAGGSYGGMLVHVYAAAYPKDVAGLVLVDSSSPDQARRFLAALPPPRTGAPPALRELRRILGETRRNPEGVDWTASADEARAAGSLGDKPLVVLTAGIFGPAYGRMGYVAPVVRPLLPRLRRVWFGLQDDLAQLSTNHLHLVVVASPHAMQSTVGRPDIIIRAIRAVIAAQRSHHPLPPCRELFSPPGTRCV